MTKKVTETKKEKFSLDTRVRLVAENEGGKGVKMPVWFNLPQHKELRKKHIDICKGLVALSVANDNYPITYLVYFAVGKNAHRKEVFEDGYTKFDEKKAEKIFSWLSCSATPTWLMLCVVSTTSSAPRPRTSRLQWNSWRATPRLM